MGNILSPSGSYGRVRFAVLFVVVHSALVTVIAAFEAFAWHSVGQIAVELRGLLDYPVQPLVEGSIPMVGDALSRFPFMLRSHRVAVFCFSSLLYGIWGGIFYAGIGYLFGTVVSRISETRMVGSLESRKSRGATGNTSHKRPTPSPPEDSTSSES